MAEIIRIPAGLNITCGIGDVLKLELNFKLNGVTFDLSGWTLEGENVAVQVLDAPNGLIELTFNEDVSKLGQWYLRRVTPTSKRLLAGFIQFVSTANVSTSLDPIQIDILDSPDLTIDIFSGEKGDTGDVNPQMFIILADAEQARDDAQLAASNADADAIATAADRVQTGLDVITTAADRVQTGLDVIQTGADRTQTGLDVIQTGADAVQTGLDVIQTTADRVQTGLDVIQTSADRVQTGLDVIQTAADRVQTGLDVVQTGADRVQTGLDVIAAEAAAQDAYNASRTYVNLVLMGF